MKKWIRVSPFVFDVLVTGFSSIVSLVAWALVLKVAALVWTPAQVGLFLFARQVVAMLSPFANLTLSLAISRYVAQEPETAGKVKILAAGFFPLLLLNLVMVGVFFWFDGPLASLLFNDGSLTLLVRAIALLELGNTLFCVLIPFYYGSGKFGLANLWQIALMGGAPFIAFGLFAGSGDVGRMVMCLAIINLLPIVPLMLLVRSFLGNPSSLSQFQADMSLLLRYGVSRIPGVFAFQGILGIGPLLVSHLGAIEAAGFLVMGQIIFRATDAAVGAFGAVALPKVTALSARGDPGLLRQHMTDLTAFVFQIGLFFSFQVSLWAEELVIFFFSDKFLAVKELLQLMGFCFLPYLAYLLLNAVIDAVEVKPVNTVHLICSLALTAIGSLASARFGWGIEGMALSCALGFCVLGFLSMLFLWRRFSLPFDQLHVISCFGINLLFAGLTLLAKQATSFLLLKAMIGLFLFPLYLLVLGKMGYSWVLQLRSRISLGSGPSGETQG